MMTGLRFLRRYGNPTCADGQEARQIITHSLSAIGGRQGHGTGGALYGLIPVCQYRGLRSIFLSMTTQDAQHLNALMLCLDRRWRFVSGKGVNVSLRRGPDTKAHDLILAAHPQVVDKPLGALLDTILGVLIFGRRH